MGAPWRALEAPETSQAESPPERPKPAGLRLLLAAAIVLIVCSLVVVAFAASQPGGQVDVVSSGDRGPEPSAVPKPMLVVEVAGCGRSPRGLFVASGFAGGGRDRSGRRLLP
jgi:hypothetical protein